MTLRRKQSHFARLIAHLIDHATHLGYEVTFGNAWRSPEEAARLSSEGVGITKSLHCSRLAVDLNLFRDGRYLPSTNAHRPLGEFWEGLGGSWGGRFSTPDGNHYSMEHKGRK
jgi:hypothetical protein